jgi:hypothetical protein
MHIQATHLLTYIQGNRGHIFIHAYPGTTATTSLFMHIRAAICLFMNIRGQQWPFLYLRKPIQGKRSLPLFMHIRAASSLFMNIRGQQRSFLNLRKPIHGHIFFSCISGQLYLNSWISGGNRRHFFIYENPYKVREATSLFHAYKGSYILIHAFPGATVVISLFAQTHTK